MGTSAGTMSKRRRLILHLLNLPLVLAVLFTPRANPQTPSIPVPATTIPLRLPSGLAYDPLGNLFFAETGNHVIRRISPDGNLTTFAGSGTQGFAGDGGLATSALLDSPAAVAVDASGNLFFSDTHNHRIRRVDTTSGLISTIAGNGTPGLSPNGTDALSARLDLPSALAFDAAQNLFFADARTHVIRRIDHLSNLITTVAGNGTQGFAGDGRSALSASIDTPSGLAVDLADNLFLSDTHNQRVRRVDHLTGIITSFAGTALPGFAGDAAAATASSLSLPRGLVLDPSGNLLLADSRNHRIRRIDAATGAISTLAGIGTQDYAGDARPAPAASLDTPQSITLSAEGLPTFADSANGRIRQIDSSSVIHTIAGLGVPTATLLTLSAPSASAYGTGAITATLSDSPASGLVTFLDTVSGVSQGLAVTPLTSNTATVPLSSLAVGDHHVTATYAGDPTHPGARAAVFNLTVSPAPLLATPNSFNLFYGQPVPTLTGTLAGILPQDLAFVSLNLFSGAVDLARPARFPITATLTGPAAGNYTLSTNAAYVSINRAPPSVTLSSSLAAHVASSTTGIPTGTVQLLDGAIPYASATLSPSGDAVFSQAALSTGSHTLTASYLGDADFLPATSIPTLSAPGTNASSDFTLTNSGQQVVAIASGTAAIFSFTVQPVNGTMSSPILLTATNLPAGATTSFNPTYLPPSNTATPFTLTIQTLAQSPKTAFSQPSSQRSLLGFAVLLPLVVLVRRKRYCSLLCAALLTLTLGCGDRVNHTADIAVTIHTYNISVLGTTTTVGGATLQHIANVTLNLQ